MDCISDSILIFDDADNLVYSNKPLLHTFHSGGAFNPGETTFRDMVDHVAHIVFPESDDRDSRLAWIEDRLDLRNRPHPVMQTETPNGDWVQSRDLRLKNGGLVVIRSNVTEQLRHQQETERSRERFALAMLGYVEGELKGAPETWISLLDPQDVFRVFSEIRRVVNGETPAFTSEYRMRRKDGSWATLLSRAVCATGPDGAVERLVGAHVDITRLKQAERDLASKNRALDFLGRVAASANKAEDPVAALKMVVDEICDFLGWPVGHAYLRDGEKGRLQPGLIWRVDDHQRRKAFVQATDDAIYDKAQGIVRVALARRGPAYMTDFAAQPDMVRAVAAAAARLRSGIALPIYANNRTAAVLEFYEEGMEAPDPLVMETLEQVGPHIGRVFERAIASDRILAAKAEAERANTAKTAFLANMSHELRTPLNAVIGFSDILASAPEAEISASHRLFAEDILVSGRHLLELINDLLDISKIEAGHFELSRIRFDLTAELAGQVKLFSPQLDRGGLKIALDLDSLNGAAMLEADQRAFRQIVANLLSNAIKFSPAGAAITIVAKAEGSTLRLAVTDQGIGIAPEDQERVFERFEQAHDAKQNLAGGAGIGLPLSRMLAEMHGGALELESELGVGSTLTLTLPNCLHGRRPSTLETPDAAEPRQASEERAPAESRNVLIAEDNAVNQTLLRMIVESLGGAVDVAANGFEVLEALRRRRYDIILMDLQMPEMDGLETARRIRALPGPVSTTPIIALSADALPEHREAALAAGMNEHVGKPATKSDIALALKAWLPPVCGPDPVRVEPEAAHPAPAEAVDVPLAHATLMDAAILDELTQAVGAEMIGALARTLQEDCMKLQPILKTALAHGDFKRVGETAHQLKGALGGLGGRLAHRLAGLVQHLAQEKDGQAIADLLPDFDRATRATLDHLIALAAEAAESKSA